MPKLLHDPEVYQSIRRRIESLRPDSPRQWGKMTADQMLWHVNVSMREAVGEYTPNVKALPVPKWLLRWGILNMPWGRGARTRPDMYAKATYDFTEQKTECLALLERIYAKPVNAPWPASASMGDMTGRHWSRLTAKHLEHHLKQFGS
jgi:hypothetical protein